MDKADKLKEILKKTVSDICRSSDLKMLNIYEEVIFNEKKKRMAIS